MTRLFKVIQNEMFKDQLGMFIIKEDHYCPILSNESLIVFHGGNCVIQ